MKYEEFRVLSVSDDPDDRARARALARSNTEWQEALDADDELVHEARLWRERAPGHLGRVAPPDWHRSRPWRAVLAAASLLIAATGTNALWNGASRPTASGTAILGGAALTATEIAERDHRLAITRLEQSLASRAWPASTSQASGAEAFALRMKLCALESTIADLEAFVAVNPYHASARLALLDAMGAKRTALATLLAAPEPA